MSTLFRQTIKWKYLHKPPPDADDPHNPGVPRQLRKILYIDKAGNTLYLWTTSSALRLTKGSDAPPGYYQLITTGLGKAERHLVPGIGWLPDIPNRQAGCFYLSLTDAQYHWVSHPQPLIPKLIPQPPFLRSLDLAGTPGSFQYLLRTAIIAEQEKCRPASKPPVTPQLRAQRKERRRQERRRQERRRQERRIRKVIWRRESSDPVVRELKREAERDLSHRIGQEDLMDCQPDW